MADEKIVINPWKLATIGLLVIGGTVMATTFVVGQKTAGEPAKEAKAVPAEEPHRKSHPASAQAKRPVAVSASERAVPSQEVIEACNRQANDQVTSRTTEVVKDAGIGAVLGAAVGAASGAIVDGGKGAGKGAAIGGIVGATGGTIYGVNENKANDEKYKAAYTACMHAKGYSV